ncbi:hypothetical protein [Nitrosomonas sp.]|uniref:hypothetical protein n=1 Tax=Nitrosomonas sp. TaxID=42353 RepID=UPI0025D116B7|nr:hypothetical protein [Nitrosomonas sp.]MBV6447988.1 hypothetical protein [Nitrosomonas sp.]
MHHNQLFHNIFFVFFIIALLTSCAQMPSSLVSSEQKDEEVGFPAKILLISIAKGLGSFDKTAPDNNECVVIDKREPEKSEKKFNDFVKELENAVKKDAVKKTGFDTEQIKEAFNLVKSGEFKNDLDYTRDSLRKNIGIIQHSITAKIRETVTNPQSSFELIRNSPEYLQINPNNNIQCEQGIKVLLTNQNYDNLGSCAPGAVGKIVDKLKTDKTTSALIETARIFTNKNNRSSRLAIIAYAKMYGINLTEDDLDKLDEFLNISKESDLSPLIKVGIDKLAERYGVKDIQSFIKKKDNNCSLS